MLSLEHGSWFPGHTQDRKQPAIKADISADSPGEAQEQSEHPDDWIDTHRSRQQVVHVHQHPKSSRDSGEDS
jgi:hypothetical protein